MLAYTYKAQVPHQMLTAATSVFGHFVCALTCMIKECKQDVGSYDMTQFRVPLAHQNKHYVYSFYATGISSKTFVVLYQIWQ